MNLYNYLPNKYSYACFSSYLIYLQFLEKTFGKVLFEEKNLVQF